MSTTPGDVVRLRFEIRLALRSQSELDPIEAWLKLNAKAAWKMEFQGMAQQPEGAARRLMVVFRFAEEEDAGRFQRERKLIPPALPVATEVPVVAKAARSFSQVFSPAKKAAPSRPGPHPAASPPAVDLRDAGDFAKRAAELVGNSGEVMASKVQLLGLDKLKAHFGDAWPRVAARADQIAERAIHKRLTPRDMVTKVHDLNYLVLFADASVEEAQLRCRMIADDIAKQLIGADGSGDLLIVKTGVTPVDGDTVFEDTPSLDELVSRLVGHADPTGEAGVPATPKHADPAWDAQDPLAAVEFVYRPMWDVRHKVVTSFLCQPTVRLSGGRRVVGESAIIGIETEEVQRALDLRILKRAATDLLAAFNAGRKLLIAVPVHFETISTGPRRIEYLDHCKALPPLAAKLMLFEVVGAPEGVPQGRLLDTTTALRGIARALMFRTSIWSSNWGDLSPARITSVGADLSDEHAPEAAVIERLVKFADAADKRKLGSYLHGLRTLSLIVSAVGAGFHHLSGQPIADLADAPPDAHRFSLADLYEAIAAPAA